MSAPLRPLRSCSCCERWRGEPETATDRCHVGASAPRHCKAGKVRCVSQARSSGSTTPRVTDFSNAKVAATYSSTSRRSKATDSGRSRKARRSNSRSLMAPRARRPVTLPNQAKSRTGPGALRRSWPPVVRVVPSLSRPAPLSLLFHPSSPRETQLPDFPCRGAS
jgi:hypothetical protein